MRGSYDYLLTSFNLLPAADGNGVQAQITTECIQYRRPLHVLDSVHAKVKHFPVRRRKDVVQRSQVLKLATLQVALVEDPTTLWLVTLAHHTFCTYSRADWPNSEVKKTRAINVIIVFVW